MSGNEGNLKLKLKDAVFLLNPLTPLTFEKNKANYNFADQFICSVQARNINSVFHRVRNIY